MLWKKSGYCIPLLIVALFTPSCIERYDLIGERNNGSDSDVKFQDVVLDVDTGVSKCKVDTDCGGGEFCNKEIGECETGVCQPQCTNRECGSDGCGGSCGSCGEHELCQDGTCVHDPWCGDGTCDSAEEDCSTCLADCPCGCGEECNSGECKFRACDNRECGSDGCGGICGTCSGQQEECVGGKCICQPACDSKCAGAADGCGGTCTTTDCDGCCNGSVCITETTGESCGKDGAPCSLCQACLAGVCTGWWYDPTSGLTWQVVPTGGKLIWSPAKTHCSTLNLDGAGWRLPNIGELRSLIRGCPTTKLGSETCHVELGGCLDLACNDGELCKSCSAHQGPGEGGCYWPNEVTGTCYWYWSSSPLGDDERYAWMVNFSSGSVYKGWVGSSGGVRIRCVR